MNFTVFYDGLICLCRVRLHSSPLLRGDPGRRAAFSRLLPAFHSSPTHTFPPGICTDHISASSRWRWVGRCWYPPVTKMRSCTHSCPAALRCLRWRKAEGYRIICHDYFCTQALLCDRLVSCSLLARAGPVCCFCKQPLADEFASWVSSGLSLLVCSVGYAGRTGSSHVRDSDSADLKIPTNEVFRRQCSKPSW